MTCSDFIEGFSEYFDGMAAPERVDAFEAHLERCESCRRYRDVFARGRKLLRSFPEVEIRDDFEPRLRHRIYHLEDGERIDPGSGSATTAATALGMAILLVLAAWSPALLSPEVDVELAPIVVSRPATPPPLRAGPAGLRAPNLSLVPAGDAVRLGSERPDPWRSPNALLYRYSTLADRARQRGLVRTGLD